MTDLLEAFWAASAAHLTATRACRAARRADAPTAVRDALRDARRAAMADVRRAYDALLAARD